MFSQSQCQFSRFFPFLNHKRECKSEWGESDSIARVYLNIMADETKVVVENGDAAPPKSAKQLAKEAAKQAKLDKLKQKLEKQNTAPKKDKEEVSTHMCLNHT